MAGPRHNWDEQSHKNLFDKVYNTITTAVNSLTKLVNDNLGDIKEATNLPTPNTLMKRDEYGRVRINEPDHIQDVVNKGYVDAIIGEALKSLEVKSFIASGTYVPEISGLVTVFCVGGGAGGTGGYASSGKPVQPAGASGLYWSTTFMADIGVPIQFYVGGGGVGGGQNAKPGGVGGNTGLNKFQVAKIGGPGPGAPAGFIGQGPLYRADTPPQGWGHGGHGGGYKQIGGTGGRGVIFFIHHNK